jgi:hypothetical protein
MPDEMRRGARKGDLGGSDGLGQFVSFMAHFTKNGFPRMKGNKTTFRIGNHNYFIFPHLFTRC